MLFWSTNMWQNPSHLLVWDTFFLLFYQLLHPLSQKLFFLRMLPFFSLELCLIGLRSALYFLTSKIILTSGCCKSHLLFLHCTFRPGQPGVTSQQLRWHKRHGRSRHPTAQVCPFSPAEDSHPLVVAGKAAVCLSPQSSPHWERDSDPWGGTGHPFNGARELGI